MKLKVNISSGLRVTREIEEGVSGTLALSANIKLNPRRDTSDYLPDSRKTVVGSNIFSRVEFSAQQ